MTKYRAKPVIITEDGTMFEVADIKKHNLDIEGIRFDSKMEAEYYLILKTELEKGSIASLTLQPKYILQDDPKIQYVADFEVMHLWGEVETIDVKGMETPAFKMKKKLFAKVYEDRKLTLITKHNGQWRELDELKKEKAERKKAERKLLKRVRLSK
jgi:hypothetical protein